MKKITYLALLTKVVMVDYDGNEGDLYVRFKEAKHTEGEPTNDSLVIVHPDGKTIAAIEILDLSQLYD